jgi:hypothetical protein
MANEVKITVGADTKQADSAMKRFSDNTRKMGLALSAMGAGGVLAIKGFVGAAVEQDRAMNTLLISARNAGTSMAGLEERILATTAALQQKTNFGDEEQMRVLAKMIPVLGSTEKAMAALPVIMDAAATTGKGLREQSETLTKALAGTVHQAESLGIVFDKDAGFSERLAQTMGLVGGAAEADVDPMKQLTNALGDVSEKIGEALMPVVIPVVAAITRFAEKVQTLNPAIVRWGAVTLAAVTAIGLLGGPLLLVISLLPKMIAGLKGIRAAQLALNKAVMANKIVLVFMAIAAALAIFATMWSQNMNGIRDKTRAVFVAVGDFLVSAVNKMISTLKDAAETMAFLIPESMSEAIRGIRPLVSVAGEVFDTVVAKADDFAGSIKDKFSNFMFPANESLDQFGEDVMDGMDLASGAMGGFGDTVDSATEKIKNLGAAGKDVSTGWDFTDILEGLNKTMEDDVSPLISKLRAEFADMSLGEAWGLVYDELAQELKQKLDDERATWKTHYDKITETAEEAAKRIAAETKKAAEAAAAAADKAAQAAEAAAARVAAAFANFGGALGGGSTLVGPGAILKDIVGRHREGLALGLREEALAAFVNAPIAAAIPTKANGGFIGGREGAPSLAMVHGGELVLNRAQQAGMGNTINVTINGNVDDPQTMARLIAQEVDAVIGRNAVRNEQLRSR